MEELSTFKKTINTYSGLIFKIGLLIVVLGAFFLFTNILTEMYDTPKFLVLFIFTALLLILLAVRFTVTGRVVFVRTPLDLPFLILLVVGIASTFLSPAPYISLLGNQLRINNSLVTIIIFVLFYFVLLNNLKHIKEIKWILNIGVFASQILALAALLTYMGVKVLPPPLTHDASFTPTGSSFSTTAILALLIPFIVVRILNTSKPLFIAVNSLFLLVSGLAIALTGSWASWIAALAGLVLAFGIKNLSRVQDVKLQNLLGLVVPVIVIIVIAAFSYMPLGQNPLRDKAQNFPREVQLPFVSSWKVAVSAFRDSPFWGTGPATFLFDFTNYKTADFNASKIWNLRFDSAFNEYLNALATLGGIGILALLSLTALFVSSAWKVLSGNDSGNELRTPLAVSGIAFFIIIALHAASLPLWIIGILILASFMVLNNEGSQSTGSTDSKNMLFRIAANVTGREASQEIRVDALPGIMLVIILAMVVFAGFMGGKLVLADLHHRKALNAVAQNQGIVAYNELVAAEKLNPYNDLYRTDLAQTNFALANAIAAAKGPTEASPSGSLTDQDKQNIQVLLQQSVAEGRTAVTLSPRSAVNWEILALLYRQIAGVAQNALVFSLDSYGRAIFQDPLNPNLRLNVGGVYYAVKNYDMAIRFFTDAINLKPDFANGYFNLSVALRDKGDLQNAQATAEKTLTLLDKNSPDYKPLTDYIEDLKKKISEGTTDQSQIQPPAAQAQGSLQQKELPKVVNLPKPEKIATPEAIKKPEASPTPSAVPTPTQEP